MPKVRGCLYVSQVFNRFLDARIRECRELTCELHAEALGHLNEAGVAARAAPMSPNRDTSSERISSPTSPTNHITHGASLEQQETVPDSPESK